MLAEFPSLSLSPAAEAASLQNLFISNASKVAEIGSRDCPPGEGDTELQYEYFCNVKGK